MTAVPSDDDEKIAPGRIVAAIIFALVAIALFVVAVVYATTPEYKLPGYLGTAPSSGHHKLRMVGAFLLGLAFVAASWFALRYRSLALEEAREAERAALAEAAEAASAGEQPSPAADDAAGPGQSAGPGQAASTAAGISSAQP